MLDIVGIFSSSLCPVLAKTVSETKIKEITPENFGASMRIVSQQTHNKIISFLGEGDGGTKGCKWQILVSLRVIRT